MSNFRARLLAAGLSLLPLASCGVETIPPVQSASSRSDRLVIDLGEGVAKTAKWQAPIENCSNEEFNCLRVSGRMDIAFPRSCRTAKESTTWESPVGKFRMVSPQAHSGAPFGSYVAEKYPKVLLFYRSGVGFSEVRVVKASPYEQGFDPNSFEDRYVIEKGGNLGLFSCLG